MATSEETERRVRIATTADIDSIWAIDSSATQKFASIPTLADLAKSEDTPEKFHQWLQKGRIYIVEDQGKVAGFIAANIVDDVLYIAEVAVHTDHQGKGVGLTLLNAIFEWAHEIAYENGSGTARVSLTCYPDVPWNGPWYRRQGFREVDAESVGPWHVQKMAWDGGERDLVRPGYRRCCMIWEQSISAGGKEGLSSQSTATAPN